MADMMDNLNKYVVGFGAIIITVVILSVILLKFKDVDSVTAELNTTIDTSVTAFQEPANWIVIVVIGVIGVGLLGLFVHLLRKKG